MAATGAQSAVRIGVTLLWFILQLAITLVSLIAAWHRPFDQSLRLFCFLGGVTLIAFVGGDHWWVISGRLWLLVPFAVSAILLPAVLLHFFLAYPMPKTWDDRVAAARAQCHLWRADRNGRHDGDDHPVGSLVVSVVGRRSFRDGDRPFSGPRLVDPDEYAPDVDSGLSVDLPAVLRRQSDLHGREPAPSTIAGRTSAGPVDSLGWNGRVHSVGYALFLALFRPAQFALGASQAPMFLASLSFMLAYAVGIARFKLLLIDQVLSRGMWYLFLSVGLGVIFSAIVGVGSVVIHSQNATLFGQTVPMVVVLMLVIYVLMWFKDRMQRSIDREFFSEKYQLDRALLRMNKAVTNLWERDAVAGNLLGSCCEVLRVEQAALYLWMPDRGRFVLAAAVGWPEVPATVPGQEEQLKLLGPGSSIQRVPSGESGEQQLVRSMNAELLTGLEVDGEVAGVVALDRSPAEPPSRQKTWRS